MTPTCYQWHVPSFEQSLARQYESSSSGLLLQMETTCSTREDSKRTRQYKMMHPTSRVSSCLLLNRGGEKEAEPESRQAFQVTVTRNSGLVKLVFPRQNGIFKCKHTFIDKPMVITKPAEPSA